MEDNNYVPLFEKRLITLRKGAEDELTQIDSNLISKQQSSSKTDPKVTVESGKQDEKVHVTKTKIIDLVPLKQLSEPCDYSAMHIFVSVFILILLFNTNQFIHSTAFKNYSNI